MGSRIAAIGIFLVAAFHGTAHAAKTRVINGTEVPAGSWKEVVDLVVGGGAQCSATLVGPRVILTAAHCALNNDTVTFKISGVEYSAKMTRSPLFPTPPHDIGVGFINKDVTGVDPAIVANKKPVVGMGVQILGYGCTVPGGGGAAPDGKLRIGSTVVSSVTAMDYIMQSDDPKGAVLCWGDSGGPAMQVERRQGRAPRHLVVGVNSRGDINKRSLSIRTDIKETTDFLKKFSADNGNAKICGITDPCGDGPPPGDKPTCTIVSDPYEVKVNQSTTAVMTIGGGEATTAKINNQSVDVSHPVLMIPTPTAGEFQVQGFVSNEHGESTCETGYIVKNDITPPDKPTCTLSASPSVIKLGENTTVTMAVQGTAEAAAIENVSIPKTGGSRVLKGDKLGAKTVNGAVVGGGVTNTCSAVYTVIKDDEPPPPPPPGANFSVVSTHCGDNKFAADTGVTRACLGIIRNDGTVGDMRLTYAVIAIFGDGTREVLPIIARTPRPPVGGDIQRKEDLSLYGNASYTDNNAQLFLYMQQGVLTKIPARGNRGETPIALEGRTGKASKGKYFLVEQLKAVP